jgi:hypothetical protein
MLILKENKKIKSILRRIFSFFISGCTIENPNFLHPMTGKKIHAFSDAPHLLKLIRNWLLDTGFALDGENVVTRESLDVMFSRMPSELNSLFKLSAAEHLECTSTERQNVSKASELLSHTVAEGLRKYIDTPDAHQLADFIDLVNNWFDLMNSRQPGASIKQPYRNLASQNEVLDKMYTTIEKMRCIGDYQNKDMILPFQNGILRSINSLKNLFNDLQEEFQIQYLLTYKLNQDALESFFSQIRGLGNTYDHPSPMSALYRVRLIILGKVPIQPKTNTNINQDQTIKNNDDYIVGQIFRGSDVSIPNLSENGTIVAESDSSLSSLVSGEVDHSYDVRMENDGLEYVAGWIAKKYSDQCQEQLGTYSYKLTDAEYTDPDGSWVHQKSQGGLTVPTKSHLTNCSKLDKFFNVYHGFEFRSKLKIMKSLTDKIKKKYRTKKLTTS